MSFSWIGVPSHVYFVLTQTKIHTFQQKISALTPPAFLWKCQTSLASYFPLKILASETPDSLLKFPIIFLGVGMDIYFLGLNIAVS